MCKESTVFNKYKRLKNMINKKKKKKRNKINIDNRHF